MADLARAIQAANQRTEEVQADYAALRERKEQLEAELAKCIGWLGEAEVRAADAERLANELAKKVEQLERATRESGLPSSATKGPSDG